LAARPVPPHFSGYHLTGQRLICAERCQPAAAYGQ
jgi:hypothetical protein